MSRTTWSQIPAMSGLDRARLVQEGAPAAWAEHLRRRLGATTAEILEALDMSPATYKRRIARKARLSLQETESLARLALVVHLAERVLGADAPAWLRERHPHLEGRTPLAACRTEPGGRAVEDMLHAIEHGNLA